MSAEHQNSLFEGLNKLSDAMAIVDVVAMNEESLHGNFCRALSRLLEEAFSEIERTHDAMKGETA